MRTASFWARAALLLFPLVLVASAACSGGGDSTSKLSTPSAAATVDATGGSGTVTMVDNKFQQPNVTVKAGQATTITVDNKGSAVHNWHVLNVKSTDGKEILTPLAPGGKQETVTFTIDKPGTYDIQCDAHPTEMKGKLTVQ